MKTLQIGLAFAVCALVIGAVAQVASAPLDAKPAPDASGNPAGRTPIAQKPVLLELFTSEGCSSCPPADQLLETFDRLQPIAGVNLIILSEHVDYWNRLGWTDPFSSSKFSERQQDYVSALHLEGAYTPQLMVDGQVGIVGSDERAARSAIQRAALQFKVEMSIEMLDDDIHGPKRDPKTVRVRLLASGAPRGATVFMALARDHQQSQVQRGENAGRLLRHVAVVKTLEAVGKIDAQGTFSRDESLRLDVTANVPWRIVSFIQDANSKQVLGVAMTTFSAHP